MQCAENVDQKRRLGEGEQAVHSSTPSHTWLTSRWTCALCVLLARRSTHCVQDFKVGHISRGQNDPAVYLAKQAIEEPATVGIQGRNGLLYNIPAFDDVAAQLAEANVVHHV